MVTTFNPTIVFVDPRTGQLTRDGFKILQTLQEQTQGGTFQPSNAKLDAIAGLGSGNGVLVQNGADSFTKRTLQATSPLAVSNGSGAAGNPTFSVAASSTTASGVVELATNAETIAGTDADRAVTPAGLAAAITTTAVTSAWVAYTPTFTGWGTMGSVSVFSRRVGDTLRLSGRFTHGVTTATEARMTLGFNGTNGGITSDSLKIATLQLAGKMVWDVVTTVELFMLIEPGVGYVTFGRSDGSTAGLAKRQGSQMSDNARTISFVADVPISGW